MGILNGTSSGKRLGKFEKQGWTILATFASEDGAAIRALEVATLRWIRKDLGFGQYLSNEDIGTIGGATETFAADAVSDIYLINSVARFASDLGVFQTEGRGTAATQMSAKMSAKSGLK